MNVKKGTVWHAPNVQPSQSGDMTPAIHWLSEPQSMEGINASSGMIS